MTTVHRLGDLPGGGPTGGVALTFDDGPDPDATPLVLAALAAHAVTATFFMCGLAAHRHHDLVRQVAAAGHTIGCHSWDHRSLVGLDDARWAAQVDSTCALLSDLTGRRVTLHRAPWGRLDEQGAQRLRARDLTPVGWTVDSEDWRQATPEPVAARVLDAVAPGTIVLLHDGCGDLLVKGRSGPPDLQPDRRVTARALPAVLQGLRERALAPVALPG